MNSARTSRTRQRGAAILLAMLILTLVATLSVGMVWLQWRGIEVESAERARGQGEWLLNGALDWGRIILKTQYKSSPKTDDLTQPWALPLAESRLSTFLSSDANHSEDSGPEAFLSGQITDATSRYNLSSLYTQTDPAMIRNEAKRFEILCEAIGVPPDAVASIESNLTQSATSVQTLEDDPTDKDVGTTYLMPERVADLAWYGIDPKVIKQLEPFVTIIPSTTTTHINANTAPAEVLMAALPGLSRAVAQTLIQQRQQKPFDSVATVTSAAQLPKADANQVNAGLPPSIVEVRSDYFEVYGQLRYEQHVIRERTLVHRNPGGRVDVIRRERLPPDVQ